MGWFDDIGKGTAVEAIKTAEPLIEDVVSRLRGVAYESLERFNGATIDLEIVDKKLRMTITLPPVSPPAV